ncbi:Cystatin-related plant [Arabidopsis suecica]|uniref:Cystatin-related plant n=1 Tax=Arabidopsis suecica TaxID=45249 RepID=A0A8T2CP48_ARASU|nr:Cystatin-related plant [Arabidopsis suecica]
MDPQVVVDKKSEEPDLKRQKLDEKCEEEMSSYSDSTCSFDSEDERLVKEELNRSGDYDFDTTKQRRFVIRYPVNFEDSDVVDEPDTDGDLVHRLSKIALQKHNEYNLTNLEFVRAVKANRHYGAGFIFYITFEAKDNDSHIIIPFQATVRYLPLQVTVYRVSPKP